jgi:Type II secretion system (T2SS), protein G
VEGDDAAVLAHVEVKLPVTVFKSLLIPAACIGVAVVAFIDIAPPGRITSMDLAKLKFEAEGYRRKHGHCAATLAELVRAPELRNLATRDRWGRVFSYECRRDGSVLIESLGADGVRGGTGDDQDLTSTLPAAVSGGSAGSKP